MARHTGLLIAALSLALASAVPAEPSPDPSHPAAAEEPSAPPPVTGEPARKPGPGTHLREREALRDRLKQLPPARREMLMRNAERWEQLPDGEKEQLRRNFAERRRKMLEEAEGAMQRLGLTLDGSQRDAFLRRYTEERRAIEEEIRRRTDEDRARLIPQMMKRLRAEFGGTGPDSVGDSPGAPPPEP